jgi:hypothetical protein
MANAPPRNALTDDRREYTGGGAPLLEASAFALVVDGLDNAAAGGTPAMRGGAPLHVGISLARKSAMCSETDN